MRYDHDCDDCVYQGIVANYDVYFHPYRDGDGGGEMVYRYATDSDEDGYGLYISQELKKGTYCWSCETHTYTGVPCLERDCLSCADSCADCGTVKE